jgi:mono/diheme cytochrome c family protein
MLLFALTTGILAPLYVRAERGFLLKSVTVNPPAGDRMFPSSPGSELADTNCTGCHSAGMVLYQPALSKAQWEAEVKKMRTVYRASIDPRDVDRIVDYLVSIRGPK